MANNKDVKKEGLASRLKMLTEYQALQNLRDALWGTAPLKGVAVMVGAGFTRFADHVSDTTPSAPLTVTLQDVMLKDLYPEGSKKKFLNPQKIADEYLAAHGETAFNNLINNQIRDDERTPGLIHNKLVGLPWSEILTTNWDSLIERAAKDNHIQYSLIEDQSDFTLKQSPRIVKLHGSLPHDNLVFSGEDYRTYPDKYALFENWARQVFTEHDICLLGSSGEDDNFLKWSGWVRDQLGAKARPIYLVGYLDLTNSEQQNFKTKNITPIDLKPLVEEDEEETHYRRAIEYFLDYLDLGNPKKNESRNKRRKKYDWYVDTPENEIKDLPDTESRLSRLVEIWAKQRRAYPGWLVASPNVRMKLRINYYDSLNEDINNASLSTKLRVLYETIWRCETAFWSIPMAIENAVADIAKDNADEDILLLDHRIFIRAAITRAARRRRDWIRYDERIQYLEELSDKNADVEALYERCLKARDELNYKFISTNLNKLVGTDPIWLLRRGALAAEVLDINVAYDLIKQAFDEIQTKRKKDRNLIWFLSREAWTCLLLRQLNFVKHMQYDKPVWLKKYKEHHIDPYEEFRYLERQIREMEIDQRRSSKNLLPNFDAGVYSTPGAKMYGHIVTFPFDEIEYLTELVGVPLCIGDNNLLSSQFESALQVSISESERRLWASVRSITTGNQRIKQTDSRFSRLSVARLSGESVSNVTKKTLTAIEYFQDILIQVRQQQTPEYLIYYMARLHNLIEFLSRLAVVSESDNAIDLFNFGLKLCISIGNGRSAPWESIDNLLRRSLEAVEPSRRADLVLDVLELPLLNEDAIYKSWQSRFEIFDLSRPKAERQTKRSSRWNSAIKKLIEAAGQNSDEVERQDAAYRLYGIKIAGVLTHQEDKDFCKAVWRHTDEDGLPSSLLFYPHVYLNITSHRPQSTTNVFDAAVVQKLANGTISVNLLEGIIKASTPLNNQHEPYPLSVKNALAILNKSLEWKPEILILMSISGESSRISN